jgi:lysophospholipase L1-like esterase
MSGQAQYSTDETISSHLERLLNAKYPAKNFEVINAATNWTRLHQQMIHYFRKIRSLEPDLVISMDGQNDALPIQDSYLNKWVQTRRRDLARLNSNFRVKMRPIITRSSLLFIVAVKTFGNQLVGRQPIDQDLVDQYLEVGEPADLEDRIRAYYDSNWESVDRGVGEYLIQLQHFSDALKREKVRGLFIQQPQLIMDETKPLTDIERALRNYLAQKAHGYAENFWRMIEEGGRALKKEEDFPFWSFLNIFPNETGEVYVDYTHLTPNGNLLLAKKLMPVIEERYPELF